jgi:hypothetical protein
MQITTVAQLFEAAKFASAGEHLVWFRGQNRVGDDLGKWKLRPQVRRPWSGPTGKPVCYDHNQEVKMAQLFRTQAVSRHAACPSEGELGKWLALMRHYGLPTRLLDWTESVLVAAFFALEDANLKDQQGVIWALKPYQLNRSTEGTASILILEMQTPNTPAILAEAFHKEYTAKGILAAISHEVDLRMMIQQSRFTIHGSADPLEDYLEARKFLNRFEIPPGSKKDIRDALFAAGIRYSTLFPDLSYLAKDISTGVRERRF